MGDGDGVRESSIRSLFFHHSKWVKSSFTAEPYATHRIILALSLPVTSTLGGLLLAFPHREDCRQGS